MKLYLAGKISGYTYDEVMDRIHKQKKQLKDCGVQKHTNTKKC